MLIDLQHSLSELIEAMQAEPVAQLDRGRFMVSRGMKSLQRPRQVSLCVRRLNS